MNRAKHAYRELPSLFPVIGIKTDKGFLSTSEFSLR